MKLESGRFETSRLWPVCNRARRIRGEKSWPQNYGTTQRDLRIRRRPAARSDTPPTEPLADSRAVVVERGQIWTADLGEGSEPGYTRPILVVQTDAFNRSRLHTVLGVVLSTNLRLGDAPGNVLIPAKASGLKKDSVANVSQLITVDRDFLMELAGRVRGQFLKDVENGLRLILGL